MMSATWLCPICALVRFPFGLPCPTWETTCENREQAHITGQMYIDGQQADTERTGIGISQISDEKDGE